MTPTVGAFEGCEHRLPIRVYYEDTDFTGVVYHAAYVRFFERGRTDGLRVLGVSHTDLLAEQTAFVVRRLEIDYLSPAKVDDALVVRTVGEAIRGARLVLHQSITRGEAVLARARVEAALVAIGGGPRRLTPQMLAKLTPWLAATP